MSFRKELAEQQNTGNPIRRTRIARHSFKFIVASWLNLL